MTKEGLKQYEEVLLSRHMNLYRNRKVPRTFELPIEKYVGPFVVPPKDPIYDGIIKKTFEKADKLGKRELELFTPTVKKMAEDLQLRDQKQTLAKQ